MAPSADSATIAELATAAPGRKFRLEASGTGVEAAWAVRYPPVVASVAVIVTATAPPPAGTPHRPDTVMRIEAPAASGRSPAWRVSANRHGATGTNCEPSGAATAGRALADASQTIEVASRATSTPRWTVRWNLTAGSDAHPHRFPVPGPADASPRAGAATAASSPATAAEPTEPAARPRRRRLRAGARPSNTPASAARSGPLSATCGSGMLLARIARSHASAASRATAQALYSRQQSVVPRPLHVLALARREEATERLGPQRERRPGGGARRHHRRVGEQPDEER